MEKKAQSPWPTPLSRHSSIAHIGAPGWSFQWSVGAAIELMQLGLREEIWSFLAGESNPYQHHLPRSPEAVPSATNPMVRWLLAWFNFYLNVLQSLDQKKNEFKSHHGGVPTTFPRSQSPTPKPQAHWTTHNTLINLVYLISCFFFCQ